MTVRDSPTRIRFLKAYDDRGDQSLRSVCRQESEYPSEPTARSWLRLREKEGQAVAERRTNRAGNTTRGAPRKDVESEINQMLDGGDGKTMAYHAEKAECSEATLRQRIKEEKSKRRKERRVKCRSERSSLTNQSG